MGAQDFQDEAFGPDVKTAYGTAFDEALYEHGHDGYNGTISTTQGCIAVKIPARMTSRDFIDLAWALRDAADQFPDPGIEKPPIRRKFRDEWDRKSHEDAKRRYAVWQRLTTAEKAEAVRASKIEKWGACVGFQAPAAEERAYRAQRRIKPGTRGHPFIFFGLAAS